MDQSVSIYNPRQNDHRVSHCIQDLQNQMCPYSDRLLDPQLSPMLISSQDLLLFEYRKKKMLNLLQKTAICCYPRSAIYTLSQSRCLFFTLWQIELIWNHLSVSFELNSVNLIYTLYSPLQCTIHQLYITLKLCFWVKFFFSHHNENNLRFSRPWLSVQLTLNPLPPTVVSVRKTTVKK